MQTLTTLRYTVEQVAQDAEALGQFVADQYLVHLDDLSYYQRAILQSAHDKGYSECKPASVPFSELRERLSGATTLPRPMDDSWFVAFEGRQFRLSVLEWSV